jgi:predicted transcriptional regulator
MVLQVQQVLQQLEPLQVQELVLELVQEQELPLQELVQMQLLLQMQGSSS